ncbi:unnamed protein product [marine sediment metagenome]|uniref:Uncharacterized protein n=1 Tax=marine sediment metagenome TaxID=412755 RepID=X1G3Y3_9ZZZZ
MIERILFSDDINPEEIHKTTIRILEEIGIPVASEKSLRIFDSLGCNVDYKTQKVWIGEEIVSRSLSPKIPFHKIYGRSGKNHKVFGKNKLLFTSGACAIKERVEGAAEVLRLSTRQVKRIKKKVRLNGPVATIHGNRKRKPANAVAGNVKDLVVELKREKYAGTNFSHFQELIAEKEYIDLSCPTVHRILRGAGIVSPKKKKKTKTYRYRKRKDCPGMVVQLDASPYP